MLSGRCESLQQALAASGVRLQQNLPVGIILCFNVNSKVCCRNHAASLVWPFSELEARGREDVAKARVFPFARVVEAVEVEVPDGQPGYLVRLDHGVGGTLDASLYAQCAQQVAHQSGLARTQIAVQADEGVAQPALRGQLRGEALRVVLALPVQRQAG